MSSRKGILQTCDGCGASYFRAHIGREAVHGIHAVQDKYEPVKEGWAYYADSTILCPACYIERKNGQIQPESGENGAQG